MFSRIAHLVDSLFRRRRLEDDLDEELRAGFDILVDQFVARGIPEAGARRAARMHFEGHTQVKEEVLDSLAWNTIHTFLRDIRHAFRGLLRTPSFAIIAILTLALGIGINTAVFSVFYGVLLHPLPYDHPEELALIWASFNAAGHARAPVSGAMLREIEHRNRSLAGIAGIWLTGPRTFIGSPPEQVKHARVTSNFFDVLGVRPARGFAFIKADTGGPAIIVSDSFFRNHFGADDSLIGQALPLENSNTLIGVLPPDFQLHFAPDANLPDDVQLFDTFAEWDFIPRAQYFIRMVARLKPGVSFAEAQRDLDRVAGETMKAYSEYAHEDLRYTLTSMQADAFRDIQPAITALTAGSAFILLICCVNVASLLLARASERRKETALRLALGASSGRILIQLLAEGAVLSLLGGAAGLVTGYASFQVLMAIRPERLSRLSDVNLSWAMLASAAACSLIATIVFALVPATQSFRLDLIDTLHTKGRSWIGRFQKRAGSMLVIGEITLAFVLVTAAALTARTVAKMEQVHPGFEPAQSLAFQISSGISTKEMTEWETELRALPGVQSAGATSHLPLDSAIPNWYSPYRPEHLPANQANTLVADHRCVTPGYFSAIGARLLAGRYFTAQDKAGAQQVAIVDEKLAQSTWPGESAIGKKIEASHVTDKGFEQINSVVVGVVEHIHHHSLTREVRGQIYLPFEQSPRSPLTFVLRGNVPPLSLLPAIRAKLKQRSPNAAIAKVRLMQDYVKREIAPASFTATLAAVFGSLALLLAATGIYGVLNYQVSRRLPEMGIRMALGGSAQNVLGMVLREGLLIAAAGVAIGAIAALLAEQWLSKLVFGVSPHDPASFALALLLLPAAALLGCGIPAHRAASANPAQIIRQE